jgi:hypothetical protein
MYSAKNSLKCWVSNASGPSMAVTLATLPVGEIGFFDAIGAVITTTGTGSFCYKKADGQVIRSKPITYAAAWKNSIVAYAAGTLESQTVTISTATVGETYQVRLEVKLPGMQGEYIKHGNYVAISGDTTTTIATALAASLNAAMAREGKSYFTITTAGNNVITIQNKLLPYVRGKKQGRPVWFKSNLTLPVLYATSVVQTVPPVQPKGYGPYISEQEFFAQGDSDALRFAGYPNSFDDRALTALSTGRYNTLYVTEDTAVGTANGDVRAPQQYLLAWNTIGAGTVPLILVADNSTPELSGTCNPNDVVTLYDNGSLISSDTTTSGGTFSIATAIAIGHTITGIATPVGGSASALSAGVLVVA